MSDLRMLHPLDPARVALLDSRVDDLPQLAAETAEALIAQRRAMARDLRSQIAAWLGMSHAEQLAALPDEALHGLRADWPSLDLQVTEPLPAASSGEENATGGEHK